MATELFKIRNFTVAVTPHAAEMVDARIIINAGSAKDDEDSRGISHLAEHMMFKSSVRHTYEEINRQAARLGDINAHTGHHATAYMLQFLPNDLDEAARLLMELVFEPAFPEEEFSKEMNVIMEEYQSGLDDPMQFFFNQMTWHLLGDRRGHSIIGTAESIQAMTPDKLRRFVSAHYMPANMLISFVGPVTREQFEPVLQQCLPDLPEGELEPWWTDTLKLDEYNFTHASKQAIVAMVFEGVTLQGEMDANFLPDIFCNALGGGMHSLLFDAVREKLGLCYHIGAHHSSGATGGSLTIFALLDEKNVPKAIEESGTIIDQVKAHGFDDELLDIAKRNYLFRLAKRRLTPMGIAGLLESYFSINPDSLNGYLSFEEHARRVGSLTNQDVMAFANRIFDPSKPSGSILMTCKDEQPEPTSELATAATSRSNCGEGWRVECD